MSNMQKRVDLVWFNAGGGHRAAAQALAQEIQAQGRPWQVRLVNLTQVLDPTGLFKRMTGMEPEDIYNKRLSSGFTLGLEQELKLLQAMIRITHPQLVQRLQKHWQATAPDLVVSLIPNFNRCLHDSLQQARPGVPLVTVMTDMADHPPGFWMEPDLDQHLVCGTAYAQEQARAAGFRPERLHRVNGMILRPEFHVAPRLHAWQRHQKRAALGLAPDTPTGLVLFGGMGSRVMKGIAKRLPDTPLILLCGRNAALADTLRTQTSKAPRVVVGYTADVMGWMELADFFIGKPGPGSLSEAVHMGLPVIVTRNAWTLPQERYNTQWVQQQGLGVVYRSAATLQAAVDEIKSNLQAYRYRAQLVNNQAVFEVPRILQRILHAATPVAACEADPALA